MNELTEDCDKIQKMDGDLDDMEVVMLEPETVTTIKHLHEAGISKAMFSHLSEQAREQAFSGNESSKVEKA